MDGEREEEKTTTMMTMDVLWMKILLSATTGTMLTLLFQIMLDKRAFNAIMRTLSRSGKMQNMYNLISNMHNFGIDSQFEPR